MRVFLGIKEKSVYTPSLERVLTSGDKQTIDKSEGALVRVYLLDQSSEVSEAVVDIPNPPESLSELRATTILLAKYSMGVMLGGYRHPDEIRWVAMANQLLELATRELTEVRTFTIQIRESEGIVVSLNRVNA